MTHQLIISAFVSTFMVLPTYAGENMEDKWFTLAETEDAFEEIQSGRDPGTAYCVSYYELTEIEKECRKRVLSVLLPSMQSRVKEYTQKKVSLAARWRDFESFAVYVPGPNTYQHAAMFRFHGFPSLPMLRVDESHRVNPILNKDNERKNVYVAYRVAWALDEMGQRIEGIPFEYYDSKIPTTTDDTDWNFLVLAFEDAYEKDDIHGNAPLHLPVQPWVDCLEELSLKTFQKKIGQEVGNPEYQIRPFDPFP